MEARNYVERKAKGVVTVRHTYADNVLIECKAFDPLTGLQCGFTSEPCNLQAIDDATAETIKNREKQNALWDDQIKSLNAMRIDIVKVLDAANGDNAEKAK